ncbi:penicillin-binding protein 1C [Geomesophilobacter sediminis]|uniref:peptidoglycan glycosyltransferase n=1 Tax=Geomesophilobacter sediminis TaxID=2798584 RepID=A0A8J7LXP2_9BACT|nr:penicillin-binding protein 1C [Geomesophilobacter sediminis]MBJ6723451.1 penicillin-binding protein 1C [Geomesophilobacter sediminis]
MSTISAQAALLPTFSEVQKAHRRSDVLILDRHGELIHELRVDKTGRRLEWTKLKDVSPALVKAVLQSEDRRFYEHGGVDWKAVGAALIDRFFGSKTRGASTISMQVAVMVQRGGRPLGHKTFRQKWDQMAAARELEKSWKKDEILEAYLNLVSFRSELQGIAAASRGLFGKEPSGLDLKESCTLAALIRSPNALPAVVGQRAALLAQSLSPGEPGEAYRRTAIDALSRPYRLRPYLALAPQVAKILTAGAGQGELSAQTINSTLDLRLQRFALQSLRQQLDLLQGRHVGNGAVLVVDNATGNILAYVGNSGDSQVDGIVAKRQAGSTLKPFLYGLALEKRLLTTASVLDDTPLHISTERGIYMPHDYDHRPRGPVTVRTALSASLNIPAVRTQLLVGTEPFADRLRRVGFDLRRSAEFYGFSLALGTADVSLKELVNAYRCIARGGIVSPLHLTPGHSGRTLRAMDPKVAYLVSDILSDPGSRSVTFGLDNPLTTRYWTAVKTGTSKDMRDNWCIGFSRRYTVGVWVGNLSGDPMWNVSGVSGAAPVWLEVMNYLHGNVRSAPPPRPRGVVAARVPAGHGEAERGELFLAGTEPPSVPAARPAGEAWHIARIAYPPDGTIIVIDPDIPEPNQRVFFETENEAPGLKWRLNGELLPPGEEGRRWAPRVGRYELALVDNGGKVQDAVSFEVRGQNQ